MYHTIVVPFDRSAGSDVAVAHATTIAQQVGAELELLAVESVPGTPEDAATGLTGAPDQDIGAPSGHQIDYDPGLPLLEAAQRHGTDIRIRLVSGDLAATIGAAAEAPDSLVTLPTEAPTPVGEVTLGSVSEQVVRSSPHPVVLIGPRCDPAPERYESIVACLDGSGPAEQILPTAVTWTSQLDLTLWLFQVLPAGSRVEGRTQDYFDSAYVHRMAEILRRDSRVEAEWDTAHDRRPAVAIARFATGLPASVVAMTTRGRSGYGRLVFGSVSLAVARHATVPVLIQRSAA